MFNVKDEATLRKVWLLINCFVVVTTGMWSQIRRVLNGEVCNGGRVL